MPRATGIGGVFLRAKDPDALARWYAAHLGLAVGPDNYVSLRWSDDPDPEASTVWATFEEATPYFGPTQQAVMINFRVDDLDALLAALQTDGVEIVPKREDHSYGKFAWIVDPEGNRVELWEPPGASIPSVDSVG